MNDPVLDLVARWRQGDQQAANELFRLHAPRLIALARGRLSAQLARRVEPEDVVQSAYRSFFARSQDGQYDLRQGGDLWALLVTITLHKLHNQIKRHTTAGRSIAREATFSSEDSLLGLRAGVSAEAPSPLEAVALIDQVEEVMRGLDADQRRMLELRLQGHTIAEIAAATGLSRRTVGRFLDRVKEKLERWYRS
jgi:RNA polymerase sigma-70 factor (ECF subfamily)